MIWPWSAIMKWRRLAQHYEELAKQHHASAEMYRANYLVALRTLQGAHRGIWRLRQKLKRRT